MNINLKITLIIAIFAYFYCLIHLLKKGKIELKYTIVWIIGGIVMLLMVIFPNGFMYFIHKMGIIDDVNGVFSVVIFLLIILTMSITAIVSKLNSDLRNLVQKCALYEKRIRDLEEHLKNEENTKVDPSKSAIN